MRSVYHRAWARIPIYIQYIRLPMFVYSGDLIIMGQLAACGKASRKDLIVAVNILRRRYTVLAVYLCALSGTYVGGHLSSYWGFNLQYLDAL